MIGFAGVLSKNADRVSSRRSRSLSSSGDDGTAVTDVSECVNPFRDPFDLLAERGDHPLDVGQAHFDVDEAVHRQFGGPLAGPVDHATPASAIAALRQLVRTTDATKATESLETRTTAERRHDLRGLELVDAVTQLNDDRHQR